MELGFDSKLFNTVFFQGPTILFIINVISLWNQKYYLYLYFVFYTLNIILNEVLKIIIKQPRPIGFNTNMETHNLYNDDIHKYGMPSGHSQSSFFSLFFLWFVKKSPVLFFLELFICFMTVLQRWKNKKHSIEQLFIGGLIGSMFAYFMLKL